MLKTRAFTVAFMAAVATTTWAGGPSRPVADHVPQIDGPVTTGVDAVGRSWAYWSYRATGEFDIAIVSRTADTMTWSAPAFIGRRDGVDQVDPVLAFDAWGGAYAVFGMRNPSRIGFAVLAPGSATWSAPAVIPGSEGGFAPAARVVRDRLVVAFRTAQGVAMIELPAFGSSNRALGIEDGPDSVDPLGASDAAGNPSNDGSSGSNSSGGTPIPGDEKKNH